MRPASVALAFAIRSALLPAGAAAQRLDFLADTTRFATFSIAAVDPATEEVGVAVTTRNPCVGNVVPWVRAGVGAVATQAMARAEYGPELLDALVAGRTPAQALDAALAADPRAARRQVAVISSSGIGAQHTGDSTSPWAGHRSGPRYVTQGNLLTGPAVLDAVARSLEATAGSGRHLADRLIEALVAGHAAGGDARKGRVQSAAVVVADPRPGTGQRVDGVTTNIHVCEHAQPVDELRRIYRVVSQTLGYRTLQESSGGDVAQLKVMLHVLGFYRPEADSIESAPDLLRYTTDAITAVDAFRQEERLSTPALGSPAGLVDEDTVDRLWAALERAGKAREVRERLRRWTQTRR
ncbi:MAG: DUF1028 domain-containing protein [Gemmatimonadetes bacterium]|nr:DUF1028 domain-containing protein [Gemmatimonadota bacterium]